MVATFLVFNKKYFLKEKIIAVLKQKVSSHQLVSLILPDSHVQLVTLHYSDGHTSKCSYIHAIDTNYRTHDVIFWIILYYDGTHPPISTVLLVYHYTDYVVWIRNMQ